MCARRRTAPPACKGVAVAATSLWLKWMAQCRRILRNEPACFGEPQSTAAAGSQPPRTARAGVPFAATAQVAGLNVGLGTRLFLADWAALQVDMRDHIFSLDLLGKRQSTQNLELTAGLTFFF